MITQEAEHTAPDCHRQQQIRQLRRDYPVIQGIVLLFSFLYVLVNLMVDVTYTLVDPRISY